MGFTMPHALTVVATGIVALALLLQIIGLATTGWLVVSYNNLSFGLWKFCSGGTCRSYGGSTGTMDACRAFGVLGVLAMGGSVGISFLSCVLSGNNIITLLAPIAAGAGAFCALLEFAIYAGESNSTDYGYSFALTIVACLLAGLAAILFFLGRSRTNAAAQ